MGKLQEASTPPTPGTSTPSSSRRWTRCAARRRTPTSRCSPAVSAAASRCASCCCRSPTCCCSTSPPTTWTPRACSGWSSTWRSYPGAVLAVTHDRYFLDNVAEWIAEVDRGRLYPYEGNYSTYLEKKAERLKVQGKKDAKLAKRLKDELEWVRSNAKGRQTKSKARLARYEEMAAEAERTRKLDFEEIQIPPGPRLGSVVIEAADLQQGLRRPHADRRPVVHLAAQRHRRRHRPERRRQDHAVQDDRRPRAARRRRRSRSARRSRSPTSTRAAAASTRRRTSGRSSRRPRLHQGRPRRDPLPGLRVARSASRARTSRSPPACCPAVSATG